jgi:hypothetical protein
MIYNGRVYDAVKAHDPSRVYPANSGSCSDWTVSATHDLTFWAVLSGIFPTNLTVARPHRGKDDGSEDRCLAEERAILRRRIRRYIWEGLVAGVGSNQRRLSRRFYRPPGREC